MSSTDTIDNNQKLKFNLFEDLTSHKYTLSELAKRYSLTEKDLFIWLKKIEININETIDTSKSLFPNVDDKSWTAMNLDEKKELIEHFSSILLEGTGSTYTIEDLKNKKRET